MPSPVVRIKIISVICSVRPNYSRSTFPLASGDFQKGDPDLDNDSRACNLACVEEGRLYLTCRPSPLKLLLL